MRRLIDSNVFGRIWAITGNVGNGKNTLGMEFIVIMSHKCAHGARLIPTEFYGDKNTRIDFWFERNCPYCQEYSSNFKDRRLHVFANFDITKEFCDKHHIVFQRLKVPEDIITIRKGQYHQLWIIDEPNTFGLDSRDSFTKRNKKIVGKIQKCRHYNADTLFITQLSSMVELRGRRLVQVGIFALTPNRKFFNYAILNDNNIIPMFMRKNYCKKAIFGFFTTDNVDEDIGELED